MKKLIFISLTASALCGCATMSNNLSRSVRKTNENLVAINAARELEATTPDQAAQTYRGIIARAETVLSRPASEHAQRLGEDFNTIGRSSSLVLKDDSAAAFQFIYDRWVEAAARAHLGLAQLAWAGSELPETEAQAKQALDLFQKKAGSPIVMARGSLDCYDLLRQVYSKQGKAGRARLVGLNQDLLKDYLRSQQGRENFYAAKTAEAQAMPEVAKGDGFISEINRQRTEQNDAAWAKTLGALQQVGNTIQQAQMNKYAAKHGGQLTPQMQTAKMMMDFQSQMMSLDPSFKKGMDVASVFLSPFANPAMGQQLINSDYGPKAPQLIKAFASGVATLSGDAKLKKVASLVENSVDAVVTARGGDAAGMSQALTQFGKTFSSLQAQVAGIEGAAGKH